MSKTTFQAVVCQEKNAPIKKSHPALDYPFSSKCISLRIKFSPDMGNLAALEELIAAVAWICNIDYNTDSGLSGISVDLLSAAGGSLGFSSAGAGAM